MCMYVYIYIYYVYSLYMCTYNQNIYIIIWGYVCRFSQAFLAKSLAQESPLGEVFVWCIDIDFYFIVLSLSVAHFRSSCS